ncbi:hypothetical protein KUCAC02_001472 [Chaenocephalus aceratus]|uniref:Uncharacterized protein n=1 Tax=Chaenocephalus aceratus TaxID=36190 RepID=A0ACB9XQT2_CHAAC|nr:hypothetical protein KUCAC02_001472 [Chaenocephalus aceratus]
MEGLGRRLVRPHIQRRKVLPRTPAAAIGYGGPAVLLQLYPQQLPVTQLLLAQFPLAQLPPLTHHPKGAGHTIVTCPACS